MRLYTQIEFIMEEAVDGGGPSQEFSRMLVGIILNSIVYKYREELKILLCCMA